jgi:Ca2+-binding EF-hand superfamily protein
MKRFCMMALLVGGGLTNAGIALGQDGARSAAEPVGNGCFERNDINADGEVTAAEARVAALVRFDSFDADGDGSVTAVEARSGARRWRQSRLQAYFEARDADGDGVLARRELGASASRFARWDGNADRRLTQEELMRAFASRKGGDLGEVAFSGHVLRWDGDRDGRVTRAEAAEAAARRFARKDRNGDGVLTRTEARLVGAGGAQS